jgi:uncharacterized membrane-anchored protein YjiN (DUF445 family)
MPRMTYPAILSARALRKQTQLDRARHLASALLCASLGLLLISVRYQSLWPGLRWLQAFAEASAIGAIADWYAVVALFRRPLGLPIRHTAIIPRNRDAIGEGLGEFVTQYLLTPETIGNKLERYDMAGHVATWLAAPANAAAVADSCTSFIPGLLRAPDDADLRRFFQTNVAPRLLELDGAAITGKLLQVLVDAGLHRLALDRCLSACDGWLLANEALIRTKFAEASKYTPAMLDSYIVRKFLTGIRALVHDVEAHPEHPLRAQFEQALRDWIRELGRSLRYREVARHWLQSLLEDFSGDENFRRLRESLAARAEADLSKPDSLLRQYVGALVTTLAQGLLRDPAVLARLNGAWTGFARNAAQRHGGQIATLIAEVLKSWNADEVGRKIELEIGRDLQFIRINGALVGGTVGVALHACTLLLH